MLVYSRDAMSHPLRLLVDFIGKVAIGSFDPDLTRSGMFAREAGALLNVGDDIDSSSCGSEDEDDRDVFEGRAGDRAGCGCLAAEACQARHLASLCPPYHFTLSSHHG